MNNDGQSLGILILLIVCAIPASGYVVVYLTRPWHTTEPGRAVMVLAMANAGLINLGLATHALGRNFPGRDVIRVALFTLFAAGIWYLFIALLRAPKDSRTEGRQRAVLRLTRLNKHKQESQ